MNTVREVPVICFAVGHDRFAIEVEKISSLVAPDEVNGAELVDPAELMGLTRWRTSQIGFLGSGRVGIVLGEDAARIESWTITQVAALPNWLRKNLPTFLKSACGLDGDGHLVWILDTQKMVEVARTKDES